MKRIEKTGRRVLRELLIEKLANLQKAWVSQVQ